MRLAKGSLRLAWRMGVFVLGTVLLGAGIVMIVTPGPAVVFIPLGLGVLATEFQWARNLLAKARPILDRALEKAKDQKRPSRRQTTQARTGPGDRVGYP
jgi:uncharacterized protein (TIGR02611 family)